MRAYDVPCLCPVLSGTAGCKRVSQMHAANWCAYGTPAVTALYRTPTRWWTAPSPLAPCIPL